MDAIFESYNECLISEKEEQILKEIEQLDEIIGTAIATLVISGMVLRAADVIMGNKPKLIHYLTAIFTWGSAEHQGSLNPLEIRKYAYENLRDAKDIEDEFGPSSSKILSKKLAKGTKSTSIKFAKILGSAIGRIAKRAGLSKLDIDKAIPVK